MDGRSNFVLSSYLDVLPVIMQVFSASLMVQMFKVAVLSKKNKKSVGTMRIFFKGILSLQLLNEVLSITFHFKDTSYLSIFLLLLMGIFAAGEVIVFVSVS